MQRYTGGPRERPQFSPREQEQADTRRSFRKFGWGFIIGGAALAAVGAFTGIDSTNHGINQPTLIQHIFPSLPYDAQYNAGLVGIAVGGVTAVTGIGFVYVNQEPPEY